MWCRRVEMILMPPVGAVWVHTHPFTAALPGRNAEWGEANRPRVAEAMQRALTRLNELESAAAAAERRVRGAEEREATLRRVVDAAKADVRSRSRPEPCVGWLATLAMLFLAFGAGIMVQTPYPTYAVTH